MSGRNVDVHIYGSDFTLRTDDDPEDLAKLAAEVDRAMRQLAQDSGLMQAQKVATLTALHMAGELAKARTERDAYRAQVEAILDRIEPLLDEAVGADA